MLSPRGPGGTGPSGASKKNKRVGSPPSQLFCGSLPCSPHLLSLLLVLESASILEPAPKYQPYIIAPRLTPQCASPKAGEKMSTQGPLACRPRLLGGAVREKVVMSETLPHCGR